MIRCRVARGLIEAAQERALALEQRFALEEHVRSCPVCGDHERRSRLLQELLEGPGDPAPTLPDVEAAVRTVFARLDAGDGEPWAPPAARPRVAAAAGIVLALAAGLLALVLLRWPAPSPAGELPPVAEAPAPVPPDPWSPAAVEDRVRSALLESYSGARLDRTRSRLRFLEDTRELGRHGFAVRRFVEGLLESADDTVALAAVRCLGTLGEGSASTALERALARPALADEALEALGDLGEPAIPALERALATRGHAPGALRALCRVGGERVASILERSSRQAKADAVPSREALLDALTTAGPPAVASLLRLAADARAQPGESAAILARLPLVAQAGPELARVLARERFPDDLAYRALVQLPAPEALAWLEERCGSHRERPLALETLAGFDGTAPLASSLRLAEGGRVSRAEVLWLVTELLERDRTRAARFSQELVARPQTATLRAWVALLIESEHPAAASGLVPLVVCGALPAEDRQWAALAIGELGDAEDAQRLCAAWDHRADVDRRLLAACLLSVNSLAGPEAVTRFLEPCSPGSVSRVLAALDRGRSGDAVRIHHVARALDPALVELAGVRGEKEGIL